MLRAYGPQKNLRRSTLDIIQGINQIVEEKDGYTLTVRQLHYQFVSKGWLPNTAQTYNAIQGAAKTGRMAGLISWTAIEDRGRSLRGLEAWETPAEALKEQVYKYRIDMWANQPWRPEIWVEKKALEGVVGRIATELEVDYYAQSGYDSASQSWRAGQRLARYIQKGQRPIIFHLGDHDPSGVHMTDDNRSRLTTFCGVPVMVVRLALTMDQVEELSPPPNFAKESDSRKPYYDEYMHSIGHEDLCASSWELDALEPEYIHGLVREAVERIRDPDLWDAQLEQQVEDRRLLAEMMALLGGGGSDDDE